MPTGSLTVRSAAYFNDLSKASNKFRSSLNLALVNGRIDETRPQNDINTFEPAFSSAVDQFTDRFTHRQAAAADVQNILQKALPVNGFMSRNRLNPQVQNDWTAVRTDLNALANAYGVSWQWNQQTLPPVSPSRSSRLSDSELNQLIRRIEAGGDRFRSSLTDAFDRNLYNQTRSEAQHDCCRGRPQEARRISCAIGSTPNSRYTNMSNACSRGPLRSTPTCETTGSLPRTQNDWATLRGDLNTLAGAYNLSTNWQAGLGSARSASRIQLR